jgi:hypothetical protein
VSLVEGVKMKKAVDSSKRGVVNDEKDEPLFRDALLDPGPAGNDYPGRYALSRHKYPREEALAQWILATLDHVCVFGFGNGGEAAALAELEKRLNVRPPLRLRHACMDGPCLYLCVAQNWFNGAAVLLRYGADPNQRHIRNCGTALLAAATLYRTGEFFQMLLEAGAKPNLPSFDGCTALILCAARRSAATNESAAQRSLDAMKVLLAHGANVDTAQRVVAGFRQYATEGIGMWPPSEIYVDLRFVFAPLWRMGQALRDAEAPDEMVTLWRRAVGCEVCHRWPEAGVLGFCSGCNLVGYCGPECQRRDWPAHKTGCRAYTAAQKK